MPLSFLSSDYAGTVCTLKSLNGYEHLQLYCKNGLVEMTSCDKNNQTSFAINYDFFV